MVIPTYRRSEYVVEAIESVLAQTHPPTEVVVVCDGPGTLIPDSVRRGPVRVVEQSHAGGGGGAETPGWPPPPPRGCASWTTTTSGTRTGWPGRRPTSRHTRTAGALTASSWTFASTPAPGVDLVADDLAGCLDASRSTRATSDMSYLDTFGRSFALLLERNRGNISGATVRRDLLLSAGGFPTGYSCAEDWLLFLNVARYAEWHFLDERLSFVRIHPGNNTATNRTNGLEIIRAFHHAWSDRSHPTPPHPPLADYGPVYRWNIQNLVWGSVRLGDFRIAWETLRQGLSLLPRVRDKAYVLVPPQITWRIEHRSGR